MHWTGVDKRIDNILGYDRITRQIYASTFHNNRRAVITRMHHTDNNINTGSNKGNTSG